MEFWHDHVGLFALALLLIRSPRRLACGAHWRGSFLLPRPGEQFTNAGPTRRGASSVLRKSQLSAPSAFRCDTCAARYTYVENALWTATAGPKLVRLLLRVGTWPHQLGEDLVRDGFSRHGGPSIHRSRRLGPLALPRFRRAGCACEAPAQLTDDVELKIYRLLRQSGGEPYSRDYALLRQLISFERARTGGCGKWPRLGLPALPPSWS